MKSTVKEKTEKKGFDLKEAFVLWIKESKANNKYLNGYVSDNKDMKLIAFFNTDKKNPKEPDVRVYESIKNDDTYKTSDLEVASLWVNTDKKDHKYLTGYTNEKEKLVGFYGDEHKELRPYIRCYYQKN